MALSLKKKVLATPKLVVPETAAILKKPTSSPGDTIVGVDRKMTKRFKFPFVEILIVILIISGIIFLYNRFNTKNKQSKSMADLFVEYYTGRREHYNTHLSNLERDLANMSQNINPRLKRPNRTADLTYYNRY